MNTRSDAVLEPDTQAERLERYLDPFRRDFRRRDQANWAAIYLQGLVRAGGRKNIENLARLVSLPAELAVEDVAQALQHFINQSPWDEERLWRRARGQLAERFPLPESILVVEEFAFVKQGRHSVGVQRQFSRSQGRKLNCQLAVGLSHLGPTGYTPLGLRLYLPRNWIQDITRLDGAGVPETARQAKSKSALAVELLDTILGQGISAAALAGGPGFTDNEDLSQPTVERNLAWLNEVPSEWSATLEMGRRRLLDELGLGHFEGRSWRGFHHHACLVALAHGFLNSGLEGSLLQVATHAPTE